MIGKHNQMRKCPRCHGSTWDPNGGDCKVCGATGVVRDDGKPVEYEEASDYIVWLNEQENKRKW